MSTSDLPDSIAASHLFLDVKIQQNDGSWLQLEDPDHGFQLEATSFAQATAGFHSTDTTSPYLIGTFSTGVQPDDVTETIAVWVSATTTFGVLSRRQQLIDAFSQPTFQIFKRVEDAAEIWNCRFSQLQRNTQIEYAHARRELLTFAVPRKPNSVAVLASMDEI